MLLSKFNSGTSRIPKLLFFLIFIGLLSLAAGCKKNDYGTNGNNTGGGPGANAVYLQDNTFSPSSMTVSVGTTVTWTNQGMHTHTVTSGTMGSPSGLFDSGNLTNGQTFSYKFSQAGTFTYYCRFHAGMSGTIIVQ